MNKKQYYIFDIDGTIADLTHRLHHIKDGNKNWDSFHDECDKDVPITPIIKILNRVFSLYEPNIIFITGRPEVSRQKTMDWIRANTNMFGEDYVLYMREEGDYREDYIYKKEVYETKIATDENIEVLAVFEDRRQCVDMWRELGLTCLEVADARY